MYLFHWSCTHTNLLIQTEEDDDDDDDDIIGTAGETILTTREQLVNECHAQYIHIM